MCFTVRLLYNENFPPWIRSGFVAFHRNTHSPAPRYTNVPIKTVDNKYTMTLNYQVKALT